MKQTTTMTILALMGLSFFTFDYALGQTPEPAESRANDEQTIQKVPDDFSGAWNRHDMKAYSDLFTEDADVVVINGKHTKGRNEIFRYHDGLHKGVMKDRADGSVEGRTVHRSRCRDWAHGLRRALELRR